MSFSYGATEDQGKFYMDLSDDQKFYLRILYAIVLVGEICNLIAAIYITFAYLIRLRITSKLVILFYVVAYLVTIGYTIAII